MDVQEFRHAISLGLGRAILHVREPLTKPFSDAVLEACLHNKARDPQVEGSRAEYMLDIVRRTGDPAFYTCTILDEICSDADTWDALHRFQLARLLAQEGDPRARAAMAAAFERNIGLSMQDAFAEEFINLDGIAGLLFAIERIGCGLASGRERWVDDYLVSTAEATFGKAAWDAAMERAKTD